MFTPSDWCWIADDDRVFFSATVSIVSKSDPAFITWQQNKRSMTVWPRDETGAQTIDALQEVLTPYGLFATPGLALIAAASIKSNAITKQIVSTETHLAGYASAANMVQIAKGVPSEEPAKTSFQNLANAVGLTPENLAALVIAMDSASVENLAILTGLKSSIDKAQSKSDLVNGLNEYEAKLQNFVLQLNNSGLTGKIILPPAIVIAGING